MTRHRLAAAAALVATMVVLGTAVWRYRAPAEPPFTASVRKGTITSTLTVTGTLRPIESITYRSPVTGRELEVTSLVPEGTQVDAGDPLVQLDTTELEGDLERQRQDLRQLQLDLQVAHGERLEAEAAIKAISDGEGALSMEEIRSALRLAQSKRDRLREEYEDLKPLLERGFITRAELSRTTSELEQAEQELSLVRKRAEVAEQMTRPREQQRAAVQLAQRNAEIENVVGRLQETEARVRTLAALVEACHIVARRPGLVVYEPYLNASPRRKIRTGDRVTASQGIVTIPEVARMTLEASVAEADVHRVRQGLVASITLEAFPDAVLSGRVSRIGTLASVSVERPSDDKRFDLVIDLEPAQAGLRPEMTARADILIAQRDEVLLVPVTAVTEVGGGAHVTLADGRVAGPRKVELGLSDGHFVEIRSGLREHDRVVLTAADVDVAPAAARWPFSAGAPIGGPGASIR